MLQQEKKEPGHTWLQQFNREPNREGVQWSSWRAPGGASIASWGPRYDQQLRTQERCNLIVNERHMFMSKQKTVENPWIQFQEIFSFCSAAASAL